ncbi:MAG TPA: RNA polymerase sigma factor [Chitinophagaceae bacterium]|jgi:RNA polymerase sigma factor (sigma-70 family)|nr:RNA polymerase sigma factor [Chitinophagaceae bacterium]
MHTEKIFTDSIKQNQKIIFKVCSLYMDNEQDKKDLFQEIVLAAWKGFKNFKGDAKFSTWLYRVALNTAITFYRKEKRQIETAELKDQLAGIADNTYKQEDQIIAMNKAIAELSKIDKALVMLYMEDYDYQEIGEIIGITANNVAVKMNRVKAKLKESSKKYL